MSKKQEHIRLLKSFWGKFLNYAKKVERNQLRYELFVAQFPWMGLSLEEWAELKHVDISQPVIGSELDLAIFPDGIEEITLRKLRIPKTYSSVKLRKLKVFTANIDRGYMIAIADTCPGTKTVINLEVF